MRRILLGAGLSVLGLAALASCDSNEANTITYTDASGNEQTMKVTTTDDSDKAVEVLDAVSQSYDAEKVAANYTDVTSVKFGIAANINAGVKHTIEESEFSETENYSAKGSFDFETIVDFANNAASITADLDANVKIYDKYVDSTDSSNNEETSLDLTADVATNAYYDQSGVYLDASIDVDGLPTTGEFAQYSAALASVSDVKYMLPTATLTGLVGGLLASMEAEVTEDQIANYLNLNQYASMLPSIPAMLSEGLDEIIPSDATALAEFKETAEEYGLSISATTADTITFQISTSIADITNEEIEEASEELGSSVANPFAKYTTPITFSLTFNTKYYLPTSLKVDASKAISALNGKKIVVDEETNETITLSGSKLSFEAKLELGSEKAKTLTDTEKANYTDMSQALEALMQSMMQDMMGEQLR